MDQFAAQALIANAADIPALHNLVQRAGHLLLSLSSRANSSA
jgi:hypothetical protein